jgi:hypothetical protein
MVEENNGSSDLDIFEGLGKKATAAPVVVPPPPPSVKNVAAAAVEGKRTLLGVPAPATVVASSSPPAPSALQGAASILSSTPQKLGPPPPPPGRNALPDLLAGPNLSHDATATPHAVPAALSTAPDGDGGGLQMDWDDDEEATHVFDKDSEHRAGENSLARDAGDPDSGKRAALGSGVPDSSKVLTSTAHSPASSGRTSAAPKSAPPPLPRISSAPPPPPQSSRLQAISPLSAPSQVASQVASSVPADGKSSSPLANTLTSAIPPQVKTAPLTLPARLVSLPPPVQATAAAFPHTMEQTAFIRPAPQSRAWIGIGLGLVGVALAAAAIVFLLLPKEGTLNVQVADAKGVTLDRVDVFVDGNRACETTPCIVKREAGLHTVKVVATGFETPEPKQVTVSANRESAASFKVLGSSTAGGTGIHVTSATQGLKLFIDNEYAGPLPQDLRTISPGEHRVRVSGSDRYQAFEKTMNFERAAIVDLSNVALKVLRGKATVETSMVGARVFIVSGSDRRELPHFPLSVELDTARSWILEAQKPGYEDLRQPIVFDDGEAEKSFAITLSPKGASAGNLVGQATPAVAAMAKPESGTSSMGEATGSPGTAGATVPQSPVTKSDALAGQATLNFNSVPASNVVLDGKPIGPTPKLSVAVTPGAHTVKFINRDQDLSKTVSVTVQAGETKTVASKLRD